MSIKSEFFRSFSITLAAVVSCCSHSALSEDPSEASDSSDEIPVIEIDAPRVANIVPAGTYESPITALRYQPFVDLQSRNLPEAQSDLVIRGGTFDTSSVVVGGTSIVDPQTGHYTTELPIAPRMLTGPAILTGSANSLRGVNGASGSVAYDWREIEESEIETRLGFGSHDTATGSLYTALHDIIEPLDGSLNTDIDLALSESDGTRPDGDIDFSRWGARLQYATESSQTDLFGGHQKKFFRWPYLYALRELHELVGSSGVESEDLSTTLIAVNHRQNYGKNSFFELSPYYRRNEDDYELDRAQPGLFNPFKHTTRVWSFSGRGVHRDNEIGLHYHAGILGDDLDSTALQFGKYQSRNLYQGSVAPSYTWTLGNTDEIEMLAGVGYSDSSRGTSRYSPISRLEYRRHLPAYRLSVYTDVSQISQAPGYTAFASNPASGLFRGNADLDPTIATNYETGYSIATGEFEHSTAVFYRYDHGLTDWTYSKETKPFAARSARNVDVGTFGVESLVRYDAEIVETILAYGFLNKSAEYGDTTVDASFYALNYPNHRVTAAFIFRPFENVAVRIDNEVRRQEENVLRSTSQRSYYVGSGSVTWDIPGVKGLSLIGVIDNFTKENFEEVPGTPGAGRLAAAFIQLKR